MKSETELKSMFVEMCKNVTIFNGKVISLHEDMTYSPEYDYITKSENYSLLEKKMENLLKLVNTDITLFEKDIETELWDMI